MLFCAQHDYVTHFSNVDEKLQMRKIIVMPNIEYSTQHSEIMHNTSLQMNMCEKICEQIQEIPPSS